MRRPRDGARSVRLPSEGSVAAVEYPAPDPAALLAMWMEWEKGVVPPGKTLSDLKRAGLRDLIESLVSASADPEG